MSIYGYDRRHEPNCQGAFFRPLPDDEVAAWEDNGCGQVLWER
ncbi:hypothetical protein SAMN05421644_15117 [Allochromatium warmingii]|uniref:Uncharacterized protein n=1 Tax=Allochromatium warmingii TaxID=61595 RepID=A0A1H3J3C6_ALLWA|nr:hypothetical protein SAMN05421644_15117 [Allochromatium warmingii]